MLTVGSLFSGIGGLDLGLERAGMKIIWQSEIDPYACQILKKHWPEVINHGDIKQIDWRNIVRPDVLCGGYPCQPFSTAGKRNGTDDPRHLWPWVREAISQLRPQYAILENVRGHLTLGGTKVIGDLASIGYSAEWRVVSAASVGANHRRDRVIIVAYPESKHSNGSNNYSRVGVEPETFSKFGNSCGETHVANTNNGGYVYSQITIQPDIRRCSETSGKRQWKIEPNVGRVADGVSNRLDRLRGLGNAVVPQVAEVIGRMVVAHHAQTVQH